MLQELMCMKNKLIVISARIPDDNDYSFVYENAIHNTIDQYWQWASTNQVGLSFSKHIDNDMSTMSLRLAVVAEFTAPEEMALFKLAFGNLPHTRIEDKSLENIRFV